MVRRSLQDWLQEGMVVVVHCHCEAFSNLSRLSCSMSNQSQSHLASILALYPQARLISLLKGSISTQLSSYTVLVTE